MSPDPSGPPRCANCGALASRAGARYCEFCGKPLPASAIAPPLSPFGDVAARLAAIEDHPDARRLLAHEPGRGVLSRTVASLVALAVLYVAGIAATTAFAFVFPPLFLLPLTLVVVGTVVIAGKALPALRTAKAPLERIPAIVVDERTRISGGGKHSRAETEYFATLELRGGERLEVEVPDELAGGITPGDAGIAFVQGDALLDFGRVSV